MPVSLKGHRGVRGRLQQPARLVACLGLLAGLLAACSGLLAGLLARVFGSISPRVRVY